MEDEILRIIRDQNKDQRELAKEISNLAVILSRHEEQLRERSEVLLIHTKRLDSLETRPSQKLLEGKPLATIITGILLLMTIAMYLIAGGSPEGIKELIS